MKLTNVIALSALLCSPALAQTASPPPAMPAPPAAATAPKVTSGPAAVHWYTASTPADARASKIIGANVRNQAGEVIGDVNEIILDKAGKVAAVVVGVGGFLGMGEREVAINYDSIMMTHDAAHASTARPVITVNATKDSLKSAPAWTWPKS